MKRCSNCKAKKLESAFSKERKGKDGLRSQCRPCLVGKNREYRQSHKRQIAERQRTPAGKAIHRRGNRKYNENYPEKRKAHHAAYYAVRVGRLKKEPCEKCGNKKVEAHHPDYSKPLEVKWLCAKHHNELH